MWEQDIGTFPVSWPEQTDEWLLHLERVLTGVQWVSGLGGKGSAADREVIVDPPNDMHCKLRIRAAPGGIMCMVTADEAPADEDEARYWREAAEKTVSMLGKHDQDFQWQAILGHDPNGSDMPRCIPLAESVTVGPVMPSPGAGTDARTRRLPGRPDRSSLACPLQLADYTNRRCTHL